MTEQTPTPAAKTFTLKEPKGMQDCAPEDMLKRDWVLNTIESVFKKHGIPKLDTPVMERREILNAKASEETNKQIYDIMPRTNIDEDHTKTTERELLSMRFDLTVSLARYVAQRNIRSFSRYQYGKVYRGENVSKSKGRFREFLQFDFDIVGNDIPDMADVKTILILAEIFTALSVTPSFSILLNHRILLRSMMMIAGVPSALQMTCCSSIDKLDKESWEEVAKELLKKGLDEKSVEILSFLNPAADRWSLATQTDSGDVPAFVRRLKLLESYIIAPERYYEGMADPVDFPTFSEVKSAFALLLKVFDVVSECGYGNAISFIPSLARGHDYYTGLIFEGIFQDTTGKSLGTVVGGGRYDSLIGILSPSMGSVPAIGFGIGFDRIVSLASEDKWRSLGIIGGRKADICVCPVGFKKDWVENVDVMKKMLRIEQRFQNEGFRVHLWTERDCSGKKTFSALKTMMIPVLVQIGEDEIAAGTLLAKRFSVEKTGGDKPVSYAIDDPQLTGVFRGWIEEGAAEFNKLMEEERKIAEAKAEEERKKQAKKDEKERRRREALAKKEAEKGAGEAQPAPADAQ
ncbi:putative Histidine--tRNA ligase [Blattamonas nauphoetae]|uniref:Histidine--tRNA ligase n=1 Tax=Blattamonas nauphoetae TaxID=2049346 RepID=A0ABQ9XJG0_9EUKA|nr:putative Histidine--tRNA ligase [Blattamonas nauphoetae]